MKEQPLSLTEKPKALPEETSPQASSNKQPQRTGDFNQTEDAVMKTMLQYFADEMLPAFGISKKVKALSPTEHVRVEIKKGYQDFNLVVETPPRFAQRQVGLPIPVRFAQGQPSRR